MKKLFITSVFLLGLSANATAQKAPHQSTKQELVNIKKQELDKKYNLEKKLILNHPVATKKMKRDQMKALNKRHQDELKLLKAAK